MSKKTYHMMSKETYYLNRLHIPPFPLPRPRLHACGHHGTPSMCQHYRSKETYVKRPTSKETYDIYQNRPTSKQTLVCMPAVRQVRVSTTCQKRPTVYKYVKRDVRQKRPISCGFASFEVYLSMCQYYMSKEAYHIYIYVKRDLRQKRPTSKETY
jgi:hypothetical protein